MDINEFLRSESITFDKNIYFMEEYNVSEFEKSYISLRTKENRIYNDTIVQKLPDYEIEDPQLSTEWKIRKKSAERLKKYILKHFPNGSILEIGCGNGWLCNYISTQNNTIFGLDITINELFQAGKLFYKPNKIQFLFGDLFRINFLENSFDIILLASSIQYFTNLSDLINKSLAFLSDNGEIHILDSNLYNEEEIDKAKIRTKDYYDRIGFPEMEKFYFHHSIEELYKFKTKTMYDPKSKMQKLTNTIFNEGQDPFPWIKILKR